MSNSIANRCRVVNNSLGILGAAIIHYGTEYNECIKQKPFSVGGKPNKMYLIFWKMLTKTLQINFILKVRENCNPIRIT